jgi:hypothetical protein
MTTVYQEAMRLESLSALEEDLSRLLKIEEGEATACWQAITVRILLWAVTRA